MSCEPSDVLRAVFAIDYETVRRDLRDALARHREISAEIKSLNRVLSLRRSATIEARWAHLMMLRASVVCSSDVVSPEERIFFASSAVGNVARYAERVGAASDKAVALSWQLDAIKERELSKGVEDWDLKGAGPPDFERLDDEFGELLGRAYDVVFNYLLNRYEMVEQAKLFESDPAAFEISEEIGRRLVAPYEPDALDLEGTIDAYFEQKYGTATLIRMRARSEELREKKKR